MTDATLIFFICRLSDSFLLQVDAPDVRVDSHGASCVLNKKTPANILLNAGGRIMLYPIQPQTLFLSGCISLVESLGDLHSDVKAGDCVEDEVMLGLFVEDNLVATLGILAKEVGEGVHESLADVG